MNTKPIGAPVSNASTVVAFTATVATSKPIPKGINCVRLLASTDCFIEIGRNDNPATATTSMLLKANPTPEYLSCSPDDVISVLQSSAPGNLYITPIDQTGM